MDITAALHPFAETFRLKQVEWCQLDGEARRLEELRKVILHEIRQRSDARTEAAKETAAYASPEYRKHIMSMTEARTKANIAKAGLEAMRMSADIWRTGESSRRAEMTLR